MSNRAAVIAFVCMLLVGGAATIAAPGTAAVDPSEGGPGTDAAAAAREATVLTSAAGHPLESGESHWQGWELRFNGSEVVGDPGSASKAERTFGIWSVDAEGRINNRVRTFTVNESGLAEISTGGLAGRYLIRYDGEPVYVQDGVGYLSSPPDGTAVTVGNSSWRIRRQTLSASWSDRTVYNGQITSLTIESNRDDYTIAVSADGLSFEDLARLFPADAYASNFDARKDEGVLLLSGSADGEYVLNVTGMATTTHVLEVEVTDTTGSVATSLEVQGPPSAPRIVGLERNENAGDVIEATVRCGNCYLVLGGPGDGTLDVVELTDENGDGRVTVRINTRYAGMDLSVESAPSSVTGYDAGPDSTRKLPASEFVSPPSQVSKYALGEARTNIGVPANGPKRPLPAGTYDLAVSRSKTIAFPSGTEGSGFTIQDETHMQSLVLTEPFLGGVRTLVGAGTVPGGSGLAAIRNRTTESNRVALGGWFVVRIDVSGVFGHLLAEHGNGIEGIVNNDDEGLDLTIKETGTSFSSPNRIDLVASNARLVVAPEDEQLLIVIDTNRIKANREIEAGRTYEATFLIDGDPYPYLPDGTTRRANAEIEFVKPEVNVTTRQEGQTVVFSGTTTVAPGSIITVSASVKGPYSWSRATGIVVGTNRTWRGSMNFADAPGEEFNVTVSYRGDVLARIDSLVVEPPTPTATAGPPGETTTRTGTPTRSPPPGTASTVTSPSTGTASPPTSPNGTATADGGTPGSTATPATGGEPSEGGGMPFAPAIPVIGGILGLVVPVAVVVTIIGIVVLGVVG